MKDTSRDKYIYIKIAIIFFFTLGMIIWTIMETAKAGVGLDDDNAFLSTYHDVDRNFNQMTIDNMRFSNNYDIEFDFNGNIVKGLTVEDVFLSQRVIKQRTLRKDMIHQGENIFKVKVYDRNKNLVQNVTVDMMVTKSTTHDFDTKLVFKNDDRKTFDVNSVGFWNITGTVTIGEIKGYFYIKTNVKK